MYKQKTCKERIKEELEERIQEIKSAKVSEEVREKYFESILAVSKKVTYVVELSAGGPADRFEIEVKDGEIIEIRYYFLDWFDGAHCVLTDDDFDVAAEFFRYLIDLEA